MFDVFTSERAVKEFVQKDRTFAQKVVDHIKSIIADIKNIFNKLVASGNYDEITAWQSDMEALDKLNNMMLDALAEIEQSETQAEKNTSEEVSMSTKRNPAQSKYENDVDAVINGTYNSRSALIMGVTPSIYQNLGFSKLPIAITANHVYSIAVTERQAKADGRYNKNVNYHGLAAQAVKDIYENISDPVMVIASPDFQAKTQRESAHKVIAIVDLQVDGKQVIAPIEIDAEVTNGKQIIDVNLVSSYFDKSNLNKMLSEAVAQESTGDVGFYYIDKNRAKSIFKLAKVQYLGKLDSLNSNGIIHTIDEKVNRKIDDVLKSKQFIRWFGDWQNKPETASKIVNADGTPKVMYHGTQSSFTAFDKKKAKSYGYYGKGFYFTNSESQAQQYGNSMAVYLDVKNPLEQGKNSISKKQLRKFLEAVAENEDYDIWNYGTEDISEIVDSIYKNDAFSVLQDVNATAIGDFAEAIALFNKVNKTSYDGIVTPTETVVYEPTQIKSATDNIGTFDGRNDDIRFSAKRDFAKQLDGWDGKTEGFAFVIGRVSKPLLEAGIPNKQIRIDASKVKKTIDKHSGMTMEQFKTIPQLLEEPIFVIESKSDTDSKVVMGDLYDANGKIVTVVLKLSPSSRKGNILDVLKISSAEGRSHINSLFRYEDGTPVKVLYEDKKRAQNWLNVNRLQLPLRSPNMNSNNIIAEYDENVNDDKNFSIKRDRSISEDASNYILDTNEYKEVIKLVDQRYRLTGKKKLDQKAIDRFAGRLLSKSQSQYSREQLTERLSALFDYIANSGNDVSWDSVMEVTANIASDILKQSQSLDRSMAQEYKGTRDWLKGLTVYISPEVRAEIDYRFGSLENFRRKLSGKVKITVTDSTAISLDSVWRQLAEDRPEMFDEATSALDQPEALVDFFDMVKPQYINPYDMDMDEAAYDFALQIYDEYFNIPEIRTEAQKYAQREEMLRGRYNAKIAEIRKGIRKIAYDTLRKRKVRNRRAVIDHYIRM